MMFIQILGKIKTQNGWIMLRIMCIVLLSVMLDKVKQWKKSLDFQRKIVCHYQH